jgi:VanZ family protein
LKKLFFLSVFVFYTILLAAVTLAPAEFISKAPFNIWDKLLHLLTFGFWSVLFYLYGSFFTDFRKDKIKIHAIGWGVLYGVLIEVLQLVLPINRSFEWFDMLADALGCIGFTLITHFAIRTEKSAFKAK